MALQTRVYQALLLSVVIIAIIYPHLQPEGDSLFPNLSPPLSPETTRSAQRFLSKTGPGHTLRLDFYEGTCSDVLWIVSSAVAEIVSKNAKAPAQLLRLMFHDCFIQGCDGSILLGSDTRNDTTPPERNAKPSETLHGFHFVDQIKKKLERVCPGVVSCSDILVLATRDALNLSGGPFFTVLMGRKDSIESHYDLALREIPRPDEDISNIIRLFSLRNFSHRETVALLGSHNIGQMGCEFIQPRFSNFQGTHNADPTLQEDFLSELQTKCTNASAISSGSVFDSHYYQNLVQGRGLIYADQQLMANNETADWVRTYAANSSEMMFRNDFMKAMNKMANLQPSAGSQGEVRLNCSRKNTHNNTRKSDASMKFNIMWKFVVLISGLWVSRII